MNTTTLTAQIEQARKAGDWDKHADLWEQRRIAEVDAEESSVSDELSDHPFSPENVARESGAPSPSEAEWLRWIAKAERIARHRIDGDQDVDGYSLDFAFEAFRAGMSAADHVASFQARGRS